MGVTVPFWASMKQFPRMVWAVAASLVMTASVSAQEWLTDYQKALDTAKAEKKLVMVDFTGSDWCGWCMKLKKEVFTQPEFQKFAKEHLVLLEVDFPQRKELPAATKAQNDKLAKEFKIEGYPTIVLLDPAGKEVDRGGYESSPKAFLEQFSKLKKK